MIDCKTVLQELDLSHFRIEEVDEPLRDHFESCEHCQQVSQSRQQFDQHVSSALQNVTIPSGLKSQLLAAVESELGESSNTTVTTPVSPNAKPRRSVWQAALACAALVMLGVTLWLNRPTPATTFDFASDTIQQELNAFRDLVSNESAPLLDDETLIEGLAPRLAQLQVGHLFGEDLNNDEEQDLAGFRFNTRSASGVIVVLPTDKFTGTTTSTTPSTTSGRTFQWRSSDGKFTYVCHVEKGSAESVMRSLFELA